MKIIMTETNNKIPWGWLMKGIALVSAAMWLIDKAFPG